MENEKRAARLEWSPTGWEAQYRNSYPLPIERWGEDGEPWVVSEHDRKLVPASRLEHFTGIDICHRPLGFVPAAPGVTDEAGRPVRAWMIDDDNFAYPITEDR